MNFFQAYNNTLDDKSKLLIKYKYIYHYTIDYKVLICIAVLMLCCRPELTRQIGSSQNQINAATPDKEVIAPKTKRIIPLFDKKEGEIKITGKNILHILCRSLF